jgi:hypothetical protein
MQDGASSSSNPENGDRLLFYATLLLAVLINMNLNARPTFETCWKSTSYAFHVRRRVLVQR